MIDQFLGRPSSSWKRTQVLLVLAFWWVQLRNKRGPAVLRRYGFALAQFSPWQLIVGCFTCLYFLRHLPAILGLHSPEPLARLYSRNYYRATWINTALDAGFATALPLRPKFLRDFFSVAFSTYYLIYADEAEEKLRRYRALSTVEFLRACWEKQTNPILRLLSWHDRPSLQTVKKLHLFRPAGSPYKKPISAMLYYSGDETALSKCTELILDFPGGGFICMSPLHHEERIRRWARSTNLPILSIDYSKAPEYPYPFAIHESLDVYRLLHDTNGKVIGLDQGEIHIVMSGDSAGANLATAVVYKVLEMPASIRLPLPVALVFAYPALDFNFGSWMSPNHLKILRQESMANIKGLSQQKDHFSHASPLSVVDDRKERHRRSWTKSFSKLPLLGAGSKKSPRARTLSLPPAEQNLLSKPFHSEPDQTSDSEVEDDSCPMNKRSLSERVKYWGDNEEDGTISAPVTPGGNEKPPQTVVGTRLTMTSRSAYFGDRILSAPMMRSMALCYIGPRNCPDLSTNYHISPVLAPDHLLAQLPPVFIITGEKDPLSDDTIIFAGRIREAKHARKTEALARSHKHGASLAMSSPGDDPILLETEEDWVNVRIIEGWSHGFLQMVSLLPAVEEPLALMSDWISSSFERHRKRFLSVQPQPEKLSDGDDVLTIKTRPRMSSATQSPASSAANVKAAAAEEAAAVLPDSSSDALDSRRARAAQQQGDASQKQPFKGPAFLDTSSILQRRREEAVFGLQTPQKSPRTEDEKRLADQQVSVASREDEYAA